MEWENMVILTDDEAESVVNTLRVWVEFAEGLRYPDWMDMETNMALETIQGLQITE